MQARPETDSPGVRADAVQRLDHAFSELTTQFRNYFVHAAEATSPGMAPATFRVLTMIHRDGSSTVSALAERLMVDKSLISRSVSELEALGFIQRRADPTDRRIRVLSVTELAEERLRSARLPYESILANGVAGWPLQTIEELTDLLGALAEGVAAERRC